MNAQPLIDWMVARHAIYTKRQEGAPWPWTNDPIFNEFSFTNVYRQLDKTTKWYTDHVVSVSTDETLVRNTVYYRLFNRIQTGALTRDFFSMPGEVFSTETLEDIEQQLRTYMPLGPWVSGAYMIRSPEGYDKLKGMLKAVEWAEPTIRQVNGYFRTWDQDSRSLQFVSSLLMQAKMIGAFVAYEMTTDLRHSKHLENAVDINLWANPGPGAIRGLNRLTGRDYKKGIAEWKAIEMMVELRKVVQEGIDDGSIDLPSIELRDIEHSLCEYDKYERIRLNQGAVRQRYHYTGQ